MSAMAKDVAPVRARRTSSRRAAERTTLELGGHVLEVVTAADAEVGFRTSCSQTPLWFGYGRTPEEARQNYRAVALTALEHMRECGTPFIPVG